MSQNLLKRLITSIILLSLLFFLSFSPNYIFIISILILGLIICIEANNIYSKLISYIYIEKESLSKKFDSKYFILNVITFFYIFFIFCFFTLKIYILKGPLLFLYILSICFFTDIGGYVFGKIIGGKKLSKISPNKTISGTIGSFIFALIPLILFINFDFLDFEFNLKHITFIFLISLISQLGDLFVSFLKRKAKIKDTGKILPGHGGVLDRLDGIIFAVPFSYLLLKII
jgi:phosphatidate cytidylyltransferase